MLFRINYMGQNVIQVDFKDGAKLLYDKNKGDQLIGNEKLTYIDKKEQESSIKVSDIRKLDR